MTNRDDGRLELYLNGKRADELSISEDHAKFIDKFKHEFRVNRIENDLDNEKEVTTVSFKMKKVEVIINNVPF